MYLVALTREPVTETGRRFGDCSVQRHKLGSRFLTVVTDGRFSRLESTPEGHRVLDTIDPAGPSSVGLLRSETIVNGGGDRVCVSMSPTGGAVVYYLIDEDGNLFCSTRIALLRDAGVPITENRDVLPELLCWAYVSPPNTMYANIKSLLLGSRVEFQERGGRFAIGSQTFYLPSEHASRGSEEHLEQATEATLQAMTEEVDRLRPLAGQVAVPLSGGIDSSILWALCHRELGIEDSYSTGYSFEDPERDTEKQYALSAAKAFGAKHHFYTTTTADYLRAIVESIDLSEEPIHMQAALFHRQYAHGVPPATSILVSGQGADGINGFRLQAKLFAARRKLATRWVSARPLLARRIAGALHSAGVRTKQLDVAVGEHLPLEDPDNAIWLHEKYGNEPWVRQYLGTSREQTIRGRHELVRQFGNLGIYDQLSMLYVYSDIAVAGGIWAKLAEAHGRGMFYPFTAYPVMDGALSLSWDVKLAQMKRVLLGVARRLEVPEFILTRRKSGLGIDPDRWAVRDGALEPLIALTRGTVDIDAIRDLQKTPKRKNATTFWSLLNYAIWKRLFIEGASVEALLDEAAIPSR
jgi:asparagine synthase (glutamine-hydrolysing)